VSSEEKKSVVIVASKWHEQVMNGLIEGAIRKLNEKNLKYQVVRVPGGWEIPVAVQRVLEVQEPSAVIALGCVVQGQTSHARILADEVAKALMALMLDYGTPITYGILTPENEESAMERAGLVPSSGHGNRGEEAAEAAIEMIEVLDQI
jgi:6,7-dimethyl-8-ribityllumazine synthase